MNTKTIDETALFTAFCEQHREHLYGYALRRLHHPETAEDAVQTALLRAWKRVKDGAISLVTPDTRLLQWLYTVIHNIIIDQWRHQQRYTTISLFDTVDSAHSGHQDTLLLADSVESPVDVEAAYVTSETLREALAALLPSRREALLLATQYRIHEVAVLLGKNESAAKLAVIRARKDVKAYAERDERRCLAELA